MHRGSRNVRRSWIVVLLVVLGVARTASADADPREAAGDHYARGTDHAARREYEAALREFNDAYAKSPHFAVLYNIGLCQVALGRPLDAIEALSRYLRDGQEQVPPSRRAQVEAQVALLEARLAEISIASERTGTVVSIDGREVGRTPLLQPIRIAAGVHRVVVTTPEGETSARSITLEEAERRVIRLDATATEPESVRATPSPPKPPPPPMKSLDSPESRTKQWRPVVGYALLGGGVALSAATLGVYLWNKGRYHDWLTEDAYLAQTPRPGDYHERTLANNEQAQSIERASGATVALGVASGALVAGGITWLLASGQSDERAEPSARTRGQGLKLRFAMGASPSGEVGWSGNW